MSTKLYACLIFSGTLHVPWRSLESKKTWMFHLREFLDDDLSVSLALGARQRPTLFIIAYTVQIHFDMLLALMMDLAEVYTC